MLCKKRSRITAAPDYFFFLLSFYDNIKVISKSTYYAYSDNKSYIRVEYGNGHKEEYIFRIKKGVKFTSMIFAHNFRAKEKN